MFINFLFIKICCSSQCYPLKPYNWQFLVKIPVTSIDNIIGSCGWKTGLSSHSIEFCYLPSSRFSSLHVNKFYSLRGEILTLNFWCCANALVSSSNYWTYWWVHCKIGFFSTVSTSTSSNTHLQLTRLVKQLYYLVFSWIVQANSCQAAMEREGVWGVILFLPRRLSWKLTFFQFQDRAQPDWNRCHPQFQPEQYHIE